MMKVVMMLLLVPTVTIVLGTVSVHAVSKIVPSLVLSKLARRKQKISQLLNQPTMAREQLNRFLQNGTSPTPAPGFSFCDSLTTEDIYESATCMCEEESNTSDFLAKVEQLDSTDPDAFTLAYNTLIGELKESFNSTCQTPCEECFTPFNSSGEASKFCGLINNDDSLDAQYLMGNFTFENITNGAASSIEDFITGIYRYEECFQYTGDQFSNSEVCATYVNEVDIDSDILYCNITYNDVLCNSCTVSEDEEDCFVADCTNVDAIHGTMIDLCQNVGANGPFQILFVLQEADSTTFTTGTCDIDAPAPMAPVKSPAASPTQKNTPTSNGDGSASIFPLSYIALAVTSFAIFRNLN